MEAVELRINNYLKFNGLYIKVEAITIDSIYVKTLDLGLGKSFIYKINEVTPVKLTDEFFARNGFILREELDDNSEVIKTAFYKEGDEFLFIPINGEYYLAIFDETDFGYIPGCRTIKYLHELQNIYFELKGKELKITELR